ncbi:hypothetical protein NJBCHELONAE_08610 [Mycobacteroides chelonae]|nr:hypothetical protein NJBCHELONAE_08610 [Mycobacteroides chelonae]
MSVNNYGPPGNFAKANNSASYQASRAHLTATTRDGHGSVSISVTVPDDTVPSLNFPPPLNWEIKNRIL